MTQFTTENIKQLREKTGAGMMDCKKALSENNGNMEAAIDWLRQKGLSIAAKKSGRAAAEGLVAIARKDVSEAVVIELNSETDFVAKNDKFQALASGIAAVALATPGADIEGLKQAKYPATGRAVADEIVEHIGVIGENLQLRRYEKLAADVVSVYVHNAVVDGAGKIAVLVALSTKGDKEKADKLGKQVAMHIAASRPESVTVDALDPALVARERAVLTEQSRASGKPDDVIEKMIEGRIRKFYGEVVLLEQPFLIDGKTPVKQILKDAEKDVGAPISVLSFIRFQLGEGVEKKEENFAAEVAAAAGH